MLETKGDTKGNLDKREGPETGPGIVLSKGDAWQVAETHCNSLTIT